MGLRDKVVPYKTFIQNNWSNVSMYTEYLVLTRCSINVSSLFFILRRVTPVSRVHKVNLTPSGTSASRQNEGFYVLGTHCLCSGPWGSRVMEQIHSCGFKEALRGGSRTGDSVIRPSGHTTIPTQVNTNGISLMCFLSWLPSRISL